MQPFMDKDFLLENDTAKVLYHDYAAPMPIFDYHCHLSPQEIAEDKVYKNITELWLGGDHYKWRGMRTNGVAEAYITGEKSDWEKFKKYAETVPYTLGNPLYHWTHLELRRYFDTDLLLSPETAEEVWHLCNRKLAEESFSARGLIKRSNVTVICTTDDPVDDLKWHKKIAEDDSFDVTVLPTFRPDKGIHIEKPTFIPWVKTLGMTVGYDIDSVDSLLKALLERVDYFHRTGCRLADLGMDTLRYSLKHPATATEAFKQAMAGETLTAEGIDNFKGLIIHTLGKAFADRGWVMQLHMGALRNNNTRMYQQLGPDSGFDSIGDGTFARELSNMLDDMDKTNQLPKTILYCLNPRDNYVLGTMTGNFQGDGIPGKIQFGSGWWFCDQKEGMIEQMKALSNLGLLSRFVGMLTDSRSFLSYTRHEYFRRILCNLIGEWVEKGEYPADIAFLGKVVQDISYNNAKNYFNLI